MATIEHVLDDRMQLPGVGSGRVADGDVGIPPTFPDGPTPYFDPPIDDETHGEARQLLQSLRPMLSDRDLADYWYVAFTYYVRARNAWRQYCRTWRLTHDQLGEARRGHDQLITEAEQPVREADGRLQQAEGEFAAAVSAAGLVVEEATASAVTRAVTGRVVVEEEIAGEHRVAPVGASSNGGHFDAIGAIGGVVVGLLVSIAIGVVTGLLSLQDLEAGRLTPMMLLVLPIGPAVMLLYGECISATAGVIARQQEPEAGADFPRHRAKWVAVSFVVALLVVGIGEINLEALAVRDLQLQRMQKQAMMGASTEGALLPYAVYLTIGLVISTTYCLYKAAKGWRRQAESLRVARLRYERKQRIEQLQERHEVKQAFELAHVVAERRRRVAELSAKVERLQSGRDTELASLTAAREEQLQRLYAAATALATVFRDEAYDLARRAERSLRKCDRPIGSQVPVLPR